MTEPPGRLARRREADRGAGTGGRQAGRAKPGVGDGGRRADVARLAAHTAAVKAGKVRTIARSSGGRPVQLVEYGSRTVQLGPDRAAYELRIDHSKPPPKPELPTDVSTWLARRLVDRPEP